MDLHYAGDKEAKKPHMGRGGDLELRGRKPLLLLGWRDKGKRCSAQSPGSRVKGQGWATYLEQMQLLLEMPTQGRTGQRGETPRCSLPPTLHPPTSCVVQTPQLPPCC